MAGQNSRAEASERNQRAVFAALTRMTKDRTLLVQSWRFFEREFANDPVIQVNDFVKGLDGDVGLDAGQKRNLTVALFAALSRSVSDLPDIPAALVGKPEPQETHSVKPAAEPADQVDSKLPPEKLVFHSLVHRLYEKVAKRDPDAATEMVEIATEDGGDLPASVFSQLTEWAEGGFKLADGPVEIDLDGMRSACHHLYIAACEALGPVATDRVMAAAVADTNGLPSAELFSPDRLL